MATIPTNVGRYQILGLLGRGAMGAVYRGRDPQLDRPVAIKMISNVLGEGTTSPTEVQGRFEREARVAARLHHPNVVTIFDAGRAGDDLYLVLELVEGETLAARLARGEFPPVAGALDLAAQVADALAAAHEAGIIHRDVKPANILLTRDGRVKVSDFGVAKAVGESTELTRSGMMVGSPAYMAPEQVKGMTLDGRADLFSLGVVLYEMLLRRKPFPADTVTSLVYQILNEDPFADPRISNALGSDLAVFLRWTLAKDREERIPDALSFARKARALAAAGSAAATAPTAAMPIAFPPARPAPLPATLPPPPPISPTEATLRPAASRRWIAAAIAGALAALAAFAVLGYLLRNPAPPPVGTDRPTAPAAGVVPGAGIPITVAPAPRQAAKPASPIVEPPSRTATAPSPAPVESRSGTPSPPRSPLVEKTPTPVPAAPAPPAPRPLWSEMPIAAVYTISEGAQFKIDPDSAIVAVAGQILGKADDWDGGGGGKTYVFPGPGEYVARFTKKGYRTAYVRFIVRRDAKVKIAEVDTELEKGE